MHRIQASLARLLQLGLLHQSPCTLHIHNINIPWTSKQYFQRKKKIVNLSAKRGKYYPISPAHAQFMRKGTPLKKSSLFTVLVLLLSLLLVSYTLNGFYIHDHTLHAILWEEMLFELELISSLFTIFMNKTPSKLLHIPQWLTKHTHTRAHD